MKRDTVRDATPRDPPTAACRMIRRRHPDRADDDLADLIRLRPQAFLPGPSAASCRQRRGLRAQPGRRADRHRTGRARRLLVAGDSPPSGPLITRTRPPVRSAVGPLGQRSCLAQTQAASGAPVSALASPSACASVHRRDERHADCRPRTARPRQYRPASARAGASARSPDSPQHRALATSGSIAATPSVAFSTNQSEAVVGRHARQQARCQTAARRSAQVVRAMRTSTDCRPHRQDLGRPFAAAPSNSVIDLARLHAQHLDMAGRAGGSARSQRRCQRGVGLGVTRRCGHGRTKERAKEGKRKAVRRGCAAPAQ